MINRFLDDKNARNRLANCQITVGRGRDSGSAADINCGLAKGAFLRPGVETRFRDMNAGMHQENTKGQYGERHPRLFKNPVYHHG